MKYLKPLFIVLCVCLSVFLAHIYIENLITTSNETRIMELEAKVSQLTIEKKAKEKVIDELLVSEQDAVIKLLHCQGPGMKLEDVTQK